MLWLPLKESFICCEKRMRRDRTREKQNKKKDGGARDVRNA